MSKIVTIILSQYCFVCLLQHVKEYQREAAALLEELNYLLSWMIHSLTVMSVREREAKLTRSSKRKKRASTSEPPEAEISNAQATASLRNLFSLYTYEYMALVQVYIDTVHVCEYCNFKMKSLYNVIILQTIDVPASLLASTLVAMEITVSGLMKLRDYPTELVEKVATCIPTT